LAGEKDDLPRLAVGRAGSVERLVARLFEGGRGRPILYRRLLVEAVREVAPAAWAQITEKGPADVEAFFSTPAPLAASIEREVQARLAEGSAGIGRAQRLVQAYVALARCGDGGPRGECDVARKLEELLESSAPLLMSHRVQRVWDTPCGAIGPETLASWVRSGADAKSNAWDDALEAGANKLFACYLDETGEAPTFSAWLAERLPRSHDLGAAAARRLAIVAARFGEGSGEDLCARAVRAMRTLERPAACAMPPGALEPLSAFADRASSADEAGSGFALAACTRYARKLFAGASPSVPERFDEPPTPEQVVPAGEPVSDTTMAGLRTLCRDRKGPTLEGFAESLRPLALVAARLGESPEEAPWFVDPRSLRPLEQGRAARASTVEGRLGHLARSESACDALALPAARCEACRARPDAGLYDCAQLASIEASWVARDRQGWALATLAVLAAFALRWGHALAGAYRRAGQPVRLARARIERLGFSARRGPLAALIPSRVGELEVALPALPAWEPWGDRALFVLAEAGPRLSERDVNRAAARARGAGADVAVVLHDEGASPDLGAVRAILDWAARGTSKAVQILPLSTERLQWAGSADDVLDLIEQGSLRGNPFDVRTRVTSSSQFFNRERLVSGLLASAQAGQWVIVTGPRRFGKSSLSLEVTRRLPGPHAYVDLAGFHHEIALSHDPAGAADAVLRHLAYQLLRSARAKFPRGAFPEPFAKNAEVGATELSEFFRAVFRAVATQNGGRPLPALVVLDEIEQAVGVQPERVGHALDVLAIVVGRLRNALGDEARPSGARVGVVLASALHPVLWAPLDVLAHQSLMNSFGHVVVPALPDDAAAGMMRGLGARQGIRFTDDALELLVRESQRMPLVLRRMGSAVLELYDAERARQGALGALEIGLEGARLAVAREEGEGAPVRVWVESEIAEPSSPAGVLLRSLARTERIAVADLQHQAAAYVLAQFAATGIDARFAPGEAERRAQEAAGMLLRLLGASGLVTPHGDPAEPDAYELPEGSLRRILRSADR
jgi:hypothetical protein